MPALCDSSLQWGIWVERAARLGYTTDPLGGTNDLSSFIFPVSFFFFLTAIPCSLVCRTPSDPVEESGRGRAERSRYRNLEWPAYEPVHKKYLHLGKFAFLPFFFLNLKNMKGARPCSAVCSAGWAGLGGATVLRATLMPPGTAK